MAWTTARAGIGWRFFAEAERRTAQALRPLQRDGWAVLHDRALPGRTDDIDHLVIGPTGMYVLDSKILPDLPLDTRDGVLHVGSKPLDLLGIAERADEAWKLLFEDVALTGVVVVPVVSLHGAQVPDEAQVVAHVDVVRASDLPGYLQRTRGPRLGRAEVERLAARARRRLPRAGVATTRPEQRSTRGIRPTRRGSASRFSKEGRRQWP